MLNNKISTLILSLGILFIYSSCSKKTEINALVPVNKNFKTLDPSDLGGLSVYYLMDNIGLKLLHVNARHDYEYILADSIEIDESKRNVLIKIKNAKFSDGSKITSLDVARSINRLIARGSAHIPTKDLFEDSCLVKNLKNLSTCIQVINDKSLKLKIKKPTRELLYYLTLADSVIIHESQYKDRELTIDDWKVISGAYLPEGDRLVKNNLSINHVSESPDIVNLVEAPRPGSKNDYIKGDIGYSTFIKKTLNKDMGLPEGYKLANDGFSLLTFLVLNYRNEKFKSLKVRQWIQSKIHKSFLNDLEVNPYFQKANQFFLKGSIAYNPNMDVDNLIVSDAEIPKEIRNGISINTYKSIDSDIVDDFQEKLSKTLGVPVTIDKSDNYEAFVKRCKDRSFEVYLKSTYVTYHAATEGLNLLYKSDNRMMDNPNKRVLSLIDQYQQSLGNDRDILDRIVVEMTRESEMIPLFYVSSPKFYNSKKIDVSEVNPNESLTFWKIKVL